MKNRVHEDTKRFWSLRDKVLKMKDSKIKRWYYCRKMFRIARFYNAVIPLEAVIKEVPVTPHGLMGICISKNAVIGNKCTIFQNVTIGSNNLPDTKKKGSPVIGDNVFIGSNAVLIGGIRIGHGCRIGAGCAVFDDVPDNATVVSGKPRIIFHSDERKNEFLPIKSNVEK